MGAVAEDSRSPCRRTKCSRCRRSAASAVFVERLTHPSNWARSRRLPASVSEYLSAMPSSRRSTNPADSRASRHRRSSSVRSECQPAFEPCLQPLAGEFPVFGGGQQDTHIASATTLEPLRRRRSWRAVRFAILISNGPSGSHAPGSSTAMPIRTPREASADGITATYRETDEERY